MSIRTALQTHAAVAVVAICGGFLGATLHDWMKSAPANIRAKRFEVVGPTGKILSYWGPDSDPQIPAATNKGVLLVFMDPNGVRRCQFGASVGNYGPELLFYGKDGPSETRPQQYLPQPRFNIGLGYNDDPIA